MLKHKKKKIGCETPEYTPPAMPPIEQAKEKFQPRRNIFGDKEHFKEFTKYHNDLVKIEDAEVYLCTQDGIVVVVASTEWVDYFMGRSDTIPSTKENQNG